MPKLKEIPLLLDLSIDSIHYLVRNEALRVADIIDNKFYYNKYEGEEDYCEEEAENLATKRDIYLDDQVEAFKEHIFSHVPLNLIDRVLDPILLGITQAVKIKKSTWNHATLMTKFTKSMYAIIEFSNLMVIPSRRFIDLEKVPKIVRSRLFNYLPEFFNTTTLILGSGSGGWVTEAFSEKFIIGIPYMKKLMHFSLKYDCIGNILQVLSETCRKTLRVLDIERSKQIKDDSANYIMEFTGLVKINLFRTSISMEGMVIII